MIIKYSSALLWPLTECTRLNSEIESCAIKSGLEVDRLSTVLSDSLPVGIKYLLEVDFPLLPSISLEQQSCLVYAKFAARHDAGTRFPRDNQSIMYGVSCQVNDQQLLVTQTPYNLITGSMSQCSKHCPRLGC